MTYDICQSCMYFQPRMLTETECIPKSCNHEKLSLLFGRQVKGFPSGVQVFNCVHYCQYPMSYGDLVYSINGKPVVSVIDARLRQFRLTRIPKLHDNIQNIREVPLRIDDNVLQLDPYGSDFNF